MAKYRFTGPEPRDDVPASFEEGVIAPWTLAELIDAGHVERLDAPAPAPVPEPAPEPAPAPEDATKATATVGARRPSRPAAPARPAARKR
jgi:hypothetical protein